MQNLSFSALTRLPHSLSAAEQREVIGEVMSLLGLDEISTSLIGDEDVRGISGGQRKRVNIGIELVADPAVLFLDEPTSGLDRYEDMCTRMCLECVNVPSANGMIDE